MARGSVLGVLAASFVLGTVASTWIAFGLSLVFRFRTSTVASTVAFLWAILIGFLACTAKTPRLSSIFRHRRFSSGWALAVGVALFFPLLGLCVFRTQQGDWLFKGNYEDLSYHLAISSAFLEQTRFPPLNPQSAQAPLVYHYLTDFHSAILRLGGFDAFWSIVIPNVLFALALLILLAEFARDALRDRFAAAIAVVLVLGSHVGASNLLFSLFGVRPEPVQAANIATWAGFREILLFPFLNFLDPVVNLFQPQRPFLLGFPVALFVLRHLKSLQFGAGVRSRDLILTATVGLLPLVHIHSFLILAPCVLVMALRRPGVRTRCILRVLPLMAAVPQLVYILMQPKANDFSGWDVYRLGGGLVECAVPWSSVLTRMVFWFRAGGFPLLLGIAAMLWYIRGEGGLRRRVTGQSIIVLGGVGAACFLMINFYRFSPNWGDCNKFYFYFHVALSLAAGGLLARLWRSGGFRRLSAAFLLVICVGPMAVEGFGILRRPGSRLFSACEVGVAEWIRRNTAPDDVFLTSDHIVHFVPSLAGRRVVDGAYTWNTGVQSPGIQEEISRVFATGDPGVLGRWNVRYVILSWRERARYSRSLAGVNGLDEVRRWDCAEGGVQVLAAPARKVQADMDQLPETGQALSSLRPLSVNQALGKPEIDRTFNGTPILLNGMAFRRGLGVHAASRLTYRVPIGAAAFAATVGLDDTEDGTPGSVVFRVLVDGAERFTSPILRWDSPSVQLQVPVSGAERIELIVEDGGDGITCDHGSWADARFEAESAREDLVR